MQVVVHPTNSESTPIKSEGQGLTQRTMLREGDGFWGPILVEADVENKLIFEGQAKAQ